MSYSPSRIRPHLEAADFRKLFVEELGWDHHIHVMDIEAHGMPFRLEAAAHKRGLVVYVCAACPDGSLPDYPARRKIERLVAKTAREHLIIFTDATKTCQVWQWVKRELNQRDACREHYYYKGQSADALIQKLGRLVFEFAEEENASLADARERTRDAFDVEKVTKRFYELFQKEHGRFEKFIQGLEEKADKAWYTSVMLNRLMFVYFIQKKRFLDDDPDYLTNRLQRVQVEKGRNKFHSFYRYFLLRLFHEGLGSRDRSHDLEKLIGKVPYLNGGIFDIHVLEEKYPKINIPDEAFERIFAFFNEWEWHLDSHADAKGNEINPEVIGYIFEKYINQKQMGAYYTKEDITEYISKNCIIPWLFDAVKAEQKIAFEGSDSVWRLLREDPDEYIYEAVRKGYEMPLPAEIAAGLDTSKPNLLERRKLWNKPASEEFALPTEIWREVVARRQRYEEVRKKLKAGEAQNINDLITYNLDIRRFAENVIGSCQAPELLRAFWHAIERVSILDPTCGSGAFLFAAMNILQPLYNKCLERMEWFIGQADRDGRPKLYDDFRRILAQIGRHPNEDYFVLKSIIVNNLYGVDIMEEAVEICKLRLFLKLAAQVESVEQIEPLPDIDFNIRAGNTLVGFTSIEEVRKTVSGSLIADENQKREVSDIEEQAEIADRSFRKFQEMQVVHGMNPKDFIAAKKDLRKRLDTLKDKLDRYLGAEYGKRPSQKAEYDAWRSSHQPFHWFSEFYGIINAGGFDVVIGNPPWVEYSKVRRNYTVKGYETEACGNLHGICTERSLRVRSQQGRMSFIVQLPLTSSSRMVSVRTVLKNLSSGLYAVPFDDRPGKLFEGLQNCRSVVWISQGPKGQSSSFLATARYQRWASEMRPHLFSCLEYAIPSGRLVFPDQFPKYANQLECTAIEKAIQPKSKPLESQLTVRETKHFIFYQEATRYWVKATVGLPYYAKNGKIGAPAHGRYLHFAGRTEAYAACSILNSSFFYVYFVAYGDCFHLSDALTGGFPILPNMLQDEDLASLGKSLMIELQNCATRKTIETRDGFRITYDEFSASKAKRMIDEIDRVLARHYCLSIEELDFIINYDIKYRMGQDDGKEQDEE